MNSLRNIFIVVAIIATMYGCSNTPSYKTVDGVMLGTTFHIVARTSQSADEIYATAMQIDSEAKTSMSIFNEESLLSQINAGATDSIDRHIAANIRIARHIAELSDGAYDITVKPLTDAYGFAAKNRTAVPNIDSILEFVGMDKFRIEGNRIIKADRRVQIDLNSIAKGYTVDLVADALASNGATDYIVEIGGEIRAQGVNPHGKKWRVAIDSPFDGNNSPGDFSQEIVQISDRALATSGNYRRFYDTPSGERVTHTINPRTGHSVRSRLLSATVIASDCTTADALATMFMAMGDSRACEKAEAMRDSVQVYFIMAPNTTPTTTNPQTDFSIFSTLEQQ